MKLLAALVLVLMAARRPRSFLENATVPGRASVSDTSTFRNCTFSDLIAYGLKDLHGGAIYVWHSEIINLTLERCSFANCRALAGCGGAIYMHLMGQLFRLILSAGWNCSATDGSFFDVQLMAGFLEVNETSAQLCAGSSYTQMLEFDTGAACLPTDSGAGVVADMNASSNVVAAEAGGSALWLKYLADIELRFCALSGNSRFNCLYFGVEIASADISCVSMANNTCDPMVDFGRDPHPGLIYARSTVTLSNCAFFANKYDYFLGTRAGSRDSMPKVTFAACVFDEEVNSTGTITFSLSACARETAEFPAPLCPHATQTPIPQTESPTPVASPIATSTSPEDRGLSTGARVGIGVSIVAVVVAAIGIVIWWWCCRERQGDYLHPGCLPPREERP